MELCSATSEDFFKNYSAEKLHNQTYQVNTVKEKGICFSISKWRLAKCPFYLSLACIGNLVSKATHYLILFLDDIWQLKKKVGWHFMVMERKVTCLQSVFSHLNLASSGTVPTPSAWAQGEPASLKGREPPLWTQLLREMAAIRFL